MSYPALCIIVYVWQAERIALEQPLSQLLGTVILVSLKQGKGGGGAYMLQPPSILNIASGPVPPTANEKFWVRTCSFLIQYGFQKSPCNLLWISQAFYELCSIIYVGI